MRIDQDIIPKKTLSSGEQDPLQLVWGPSVRTNIVKARLQKLYMVLYSMDTGSLIVHRFIRMRIVLGRS